MARRKSKQNSGMSSLLSMLFGLAVGLSVAVAVYMKDRRPEPEAQPPQPEPASLQNALDDNGETPAPPEPESKEEKRFTFYDILPNVEVVTPEKTETRESSVPPQAVVEPGTYVLQAGSFSTHQDADKRRAELGMHGIESHIQRVKVNDRNYHRVYIGPTDNLDELNMLRSRLRAAQIDVLRIRLSD